MNQKVRKYKAAFIRIFDGTRWYYASTCETKDIQEEIYTLSSYAKSNLSINIDPVVKKLEANIGSFIEFKGRQISSIALEEKLNLLKSYLPILNSTPWLKMWRAQYIDKQIVKEFYSSKGAALKFGVQNAGMSIALMLADGEKNFTNSFQKAFDDFESLKGREEEFKAYILECRDFRKIKTGAAWKI